MGISEDATVTTKGQVTIPKRVRDALDIEAGERLEFVVSDDGELAVRRQRAPMERLRDVREQLAPLDVDVEELRDEADAEWSRVG